MSIKNLIALSVRQPNRSNVEIIDWAVQRIQDLEQENSQLKEHNEELQHYNVAISISEMRLKAEVESLIPYRGNQPDLTQRMAEHDAEVIDKFINEVSNQRGYAVEGWDTCWVVDVEDMENYAQQLRQKAQESSK